MLQPPPWSEMSDEDLVHELDHMHEKRRDVFRTGHAQAWRNHLERTAQLKADYLRRFPPGGHRCRREVRLYPASATAEG